MQMFLKSSASRFALCLASKLSTFVLLSSSIFLMSSSEAWACCNCSLTLSVADPFVWQEAEDDFDQKINDEFIRLENFIIHEMWEESILPAMMLAAEQFTAVGMQQMLVIGTFMDAKQQMETQQLMQVMQARAHKDYVPSVGLCEFGTVIKSLAATERHAEYNAVLLAQRSQDRQLGNGYTAGSYGNDLDKEFRVLQFKEKYCDEKDRNNALAAICTAMLYASITDPDKTQINRDIDYFTLLDSPWTIKMDFTNTVINQTVAPIIDNVDEEDVLALSANLFAHNVFPRAPARLLLNKPGEPLTEMQQAYMDMRAIVAKRSVAENSYNAIAAMKAEGNQAEDASGNPVPMNARIFLEPILAELGVPNAEILNVLGTNPSYFAQMELLTKKIYQNPDFFTNLYDTPANVDRKLVALEAIKLMQKFDMFKSNLRNEASFSVLLELAVIDLQKEIEDQIKVADVTDSR